MDDIAVTKYMETVISKFLEAENEEQMEDKLNLDIEGKFKEKLGPLKIKGDVEFDLKKNLEQASNDITVTKFLDSPGNDTSVTKFLNTGNDTSVTKFLN